MMKNRLGIVVARSRRKRKLLVSALQTKLLILIFASAVIPASIVALCLYYLIFNLSAWQLGIPEAIAYNLFPVARKVNIIIFISLPLVLLIIWIIAVRLSHRIAGPLYRLEKELSLRISGEKHGPIKLRKKDELKTLADKINTLIKKQEDRHLI